MVAAILAWLVSSAPANAVIHVNLHSAEAHLVNASNSDDGNYQTQELTSALHNLEAARESEQDQGHRSAAIRYTDAALTNLKNDETPDKIKQNISQALEEVRTNISLVEPALAAQPAASTSPFSGTKWLSIANYQGGPSTIVFESDGKWMEDWDAKHTEGRWLANKENTEAVVTREDNFVFHYELNADKNLVRNYGSLVYQLIASPGNPGAVNPFGTPAPTPTPTPAVAPAAIVKLTEDQARAVVLITGDNAEGTGFLIKTPDGPVVVTNLHVIANNPNIRILTNTGVQITTLGLKGALDRDLVMFAIQDDKYSYLDLATDISNTVQPGDDVITPGNSQGGEVVLNTAGKILGIGPQRIEFDNPVYHGNSGGPVFHSSSGKVLAVVTEATKVDVSNEIDKASFASHNSAISGSMRYFGLRLDTVPKWEPYDWKRFQNETLFLEEFHQQSRRLDSFLNPAAKNQPENTNAEDGDNGIPFSKLYFLDDKIRRANENYFRQASGADASQRLDALRQLAGELDDIADTNMDVIQDMNNFYAFDQYRAKGEIAYRKALKAELGSVSEDVGRLGGLPRAGN